ncbi:MAG: hypothetical protein CMO40_01115 [Verrucomicrobiaceae bacterium]|nr:hypothetical protein [Verrucomicrobiaceae bacterium]
MIRPLTTIYLTAGGLWILAGCGGPGEEVNSPGVPGEAEAACFSPRRGEVWKYRVQKEIPVELRLSKSDAARRPQRTDNAHLITFEQVRTCTGTRVFEHTGRSLTGIAISEDGKKLGEELYQTGPEGLLSWGWIPADVKDEDVKLLPEGVPIATSGMQPGETWESVGANAENPFLFRVIERDQITVPAGTFQACRIQITSKKISSDPNTGSDQINYLKRTVWFAEQVGVVREEIVYYGEQKVRVKQRSELVHWSPPSGESTPDPPMVSSSKKTLALPVERRHGQ